MIIRGNTVQEIQDSIRSLLKEGKLHEGDFLPSVRELAEQLGVNRNTVASAYKNLILLGIVVSKGRLGTQIKIQQKIRSLEGYQAKLTQNIVDLAHGNPLRTFLACLENIQLKQFYCAVYGDDIYHEGLLKIAQKYIFSDIHQTNTINFSHGAIDAIERILQAYLVSGDKIAVEQPGFITSINTLEQQQYKMYPYTVSSTGFNVTELQSALENNIQAVILTPRAQNPTGYSLDQEQAKKIKALLTHYPHVLVIIDDHFSILSTHCYHHIIPESTQHWAVIRSVSKYLAPDFRFAFISSDEETSTKLRCKLNAGSTWVSHILQEIIYQLLQDENFDTRIKEAQTYYHIQNQKLINHLQRCNIPCATQYDGLNIWLDLPHTDKCTKLLAQQGWLVRSGQDFRIDKDISGLRISTAEMTDLQMQNFAQVMQNIYQILLYI